VRLATLHKDATTCAARIDDDHATEVAGCRDVGELLLDPAWPDRAASASGATHDLGAVEYAPLVPKPDKVVCVGLNYRSHILETGAELPTSPTLFAKFSGALIGARDPILLPSVSDEMDWEAELGVVIGRRARAVPETEASTAIAGFTVVNDVTARDWQRHTSQWIAGKTFESTTPVGPWLVTLDDPAIDGVPGFDITCEVDGEEMQRANTSDLLFGPSALVAYISTIITMVAGDIIATGTPSGVGFTRQPPRFLSAGTQVVTRIEGVGECVNDCKAEAKY
jgi:acylpyruvate hydrolase